MDNKILDMYAFYIDGRIITRDHYGYLMVPGGFIDPEVDDDPEQLIMFFYNEATRGDDIMSPWLDEVVHYIQGYNEAMLRSIAATDLMRGGRVISEIQVNNIVDTELANLYRNFRYSSIADYVYQVINESGNFFSVDSSIISLLSDNNNFEGLPEETREASLESYVVNSAIMPLFPDVTDGSLGFVSSGKTMHYIGGDKLANIRQRRQEVFKRIFQQDDISVF